MAVWFHLGVHFGLRQIYALIKIKTQMKNNESTFSFLRSACRSQPVLVSAKDLVEHHKTQPGGGFVFPTKRLLLSGLVVWLLVFYLN